MKINFILYIILTVIIAFTNNKTSFAQQRNTLSGKVTESTSKLPVEYASIGVYYEKDSALVTGTVSDANGLFSISGLKEGKYYVEISFIGFKTKRISSVSISKGGKDLGDISLEGNLAMLQEIEVQGEKSSIVQKIDRQVFKADNFENAVGGTATDILRNLPSVAVDAEGKITLRGTSGFIVLLDGKPVQSDPADLLNQLPANAIENIEVITSPSAKYDPDGKGGIINITTKKGTTDGISLISNLQLGAPTFDNFGNERKAYRYGGDVTINFRKNKWDIGAGLDFRRNDYAGYRLGEVTTQQTEDYTTLLPSEGERSYMQKAYSGRVTAAYEINKRNSVSAGIYTGIRTQHRDANLLYTQSRWRDDEEIDLLSYYNINFRERRSDFFIGSLDYAHTFHNKSTLLVSGLYEKTILGGPTDNLNVNPAEHSETINHQIMDEHNPLDGFRWNLDYTLPLSSNKKFEAGYQFRNLLHVGEFAYRERILGTQDFQLLPQFGSDITLRRKIHSLYSQVSSTGKKLSYNVGLRLESTDRRLDQEGNPVPYELNLLNLFPSINMVYELGNQYRAKTSYNRRIERTTTSMMNPFLARRHSEVLEEGDPDLLPEFIDVVEIGIVKDFKSSSVFANIYHQRTNNVISRINSVYNDSILYRTYTNAGVANATGLEFGTDLKLTEWWKLFAGGNVYHYLISGVLNGNSIRTGSINYTINANTTFNLSSSLTLQWTLNYLSRTVTVQGEESRFFLPGASLRKKFNNGKSSLGLQWQSIGMGIFNSNEQTVTNRGNHFFTSTSYIKEQDMVLLNFTYNINQLSKKVKFTRSEFGEKEF